MEALKAKVFISCGQRKDSSEVEVARAIAKVLEDMGFEPYVASQQQTLRGLKENIFSQLSASEYFLFIDFLREQLVDSKEHRGSLFSHQELAIASYLGLEAIAFQQRGVKTLDGMMGAMQLNSIPFDDPAMLSQLVQQQVKKIGWRADWKNALKITRQSEEFDDAYIINMPERPLARYLHLSVENLNVWKIALNCTAYIESIVDLKTNTSIPIKTAELKWAGYSQPTVAIMPKSYRDLDAFFVLHSHPQILRFNCFTDSGYFMRPIQGPGKFRLNYVVISENFPPARITVEATIENSIAGVRLVQSEPESN